MAKQTIEISVPDGKVGKVVGTTVLSNSEFSLRVVLEDIPPKTKWRPPTKLDLLGMDSIPGRVRDRSIYEWEEADIAAALTGSLGGYSDCDGTFWRYAEIEVPIDEPPPREAWVRHYTDSRENPWGMAFGEEERALRYALREVEVIHMVEVRKPHATPSA